MTPEERQACERAIQQAPGSLEAARASYFLGLADAQDGRWKEAGERWQALVLSHPGSGWDRLAQFKVAQALEEVADPARAYVQYQNVLQGPALADLHDRSRAALQRLGASLTLDQVQALLALALLPEFEPRLRLRMASEILAAQGSAAARPWVEDFLARYKGGPLLEEIDALSVKLEESVAIDKRCLILIIPFSGPLAPYGEKLKNGVELALEQFNTGKADADRLRLVLADESGTTQAAITALRAQIDKEMPIGLLGPLSSEAASALAPLLSAWRLPALSPSAARPELAGISPWFFRNCLTAEMQGGAMADHALLEMRLTRVAALYPDSAYGRSLALAFAGRVSEMAGSLAALVSYTAGARDYHPAMLALGGVDPAEAKNSEAAEKRDQLSEIENASTALGRVLLEARQARAVALTQGAAALTGAERGAPPPLTYTPALRLAVVDFASDSAAARLNAGRAFAERFRQVLSQLDELQVLEPALAGRWLEQHHLSPSDLGLSQVQALGRDLNADFVLGGAVAELLPEMDALTSTAQGSGPEAKQARSDLQRFARAQVYELVAQLVDTYAGTVTASRRFQFTKYKTPPGNPLAIQALFLPAPADEVALVAPNLAFFELRFPLLGSDAWDKPSLLKGAADIEGAHYSTGFSEAAGADSPAGIFAAAYRARHAERPGVFSAQAFDAAQVMIKVIAEGADNRAKLRAGLARLSDYEGVSGRISFAGRQDAAKRPPILMIKDGDPVLVK